LAVRISRPIISPVKLKQLLFRHSILDFWNYSITAQLNSKLQISNSLRYVPLLALRRVHLALVLHHLALQVRVFHHRRLVHRAFQVVAAHFHRVHHAHRAFRVHHLRFRPRPLHSHRRVPATQVPHPLLYRPPLPLRFRAVALHPVRVFRVLAFHHRRPAPLLAQVALFPVVLHHPALVLPQALLLALLAQVALFLHLLAHRALVARRPVRRRPFRVQALRVFRQAVAHGVRHAHRLFHRPRSRPRSRPRPRVHQAAHHPALPPSRRLAHRPLSLRVASRRPLRAFLLLPVAPRSHRVRHAAQAHFLLLRAVVRRLLARQVRFHLARHFLLHLLAPVAHFRRQVHHLARRVPFHLPVHLRRHFPAQALRVSALRVRALALQAQVFQALAPQAPSRPVVAVLRRFHPVLAVLRHSRPVVALRSLFQAPLRVVRFQALHPAQAPRFRVLAPAVAPLSRRPAHPFQALHQRAYRRPARPVALSLARFHLRVRPLRPANLAQAQFHLPLHAVAPYPLQAPLSRPHPAPSRPQAR